MVKGNLPSGFVRGGVFGATLVVGAVTYYFYFIHKHKKSSKNFDAKILIRKLEERVQVSFFMSYSWRELNRLHYRQHDSHHLEEACVGWYPIWCIAVLSSKHKYSDQDYALIYHFTWCISLQRDEGKRGIRSLIIPGELYAAASDLMNAKVVSSTSTIETLIKEQ